MEITRLSAGIPLVLISTFVCFGQSKSAPTPLLSRLAGNWTENEGKRKLGSSSELKFERSPDGALSEIRGGSTQPVRMDGKPYQVGLQNTVVWKQTGRDQFERQFFVGGQLESTRHIGISNGGKTLTEETERRQADGKPSLIVTAVYGRSSGTGPGLAGTWSEQSRYSNIPAQITLKVAGANSLSYVSSQGIIYTAALDGKPVPVNAQAGSGGASIALRQIDDFTIASSLTRDGAVTGSGTITISPDGKVMTTVATGAGPMGNGVPSIRVWEKLSSTPDPLTARLSGNWKENEEKRNLVLFPELNFQRNPDGGLAEIRGGAAPVTQAIHFDGKPYDAGSRNTVVWSQKGSDQFERQFFLGGQLETTRRIRISNGGKTLTEETERQQPGGKPSLIVTAVYIRSSGTGSGLAGTWSEQSRHSNFPSQITLSSAGINSLSYLNSQGVTYTAALDNKPVPVTGPGVVKGGTIAFRQIDDYTIASTLSRNGVVTGYGTIAVSPDGKVMTTAIANTGPSANGEPSVRVWEKQ